MLKTVYELETALLRSQHRRGELKEAVARARATLREANVSQVEYGGIRALVDKLSGKYQDKAEELSREVRKADAALQALLRQQEAEIAELSSLQEQRALLPSLEQLCTAENEELWSALERRYCAEALLPLLTRVEAALTEYRAMLRGEYPILSLSEQSAIGAAPIAAAEKCRKLLDRLAAVQELPETGFFRSPAAFLSAAARHNQLDRAGDALDQTIQLKQELSRLLTVPDEGKE